MGEGSFSLTKKIQEPLGIQIAENYYMYTEEQINKANLSTRKRGPKPKNKAEEQPEKQAA